MVNLTSALQRSLKMVVGRSQDLAQTTVLLCSVFIFNIRYRVYLLVLRFTVYLESNLNGDYTGKYHEYHKT